MKTDSRIAAKPALAGDAGSASFPTEFRGVQWNDGWEFDAPCVIYYPPPFMCFGIGGNTGHLDSMVEDICMNLSLKWDHNDGGLDRECEWRGWSKRGFARRRDARHVVFKVKWQEGPDGPEWTVVDRKETYGLPKLNNKVRDARAESGASPSVEAPTE